MIKNKRKYQEIQSSEKQTHDSGRSMVEMLGTLAVIGVLSIAGIMGYKYAMNRYQVNQIASELNMLSNQIFLTMSMPREGEYDLTLGDPYDDSSIVSAPYTFDFGCGRDITLVTPCIEDEPHYFLSLENVPAEIRKPLVQMMEQVPNVVSVTEDEDLVAFVFEREGLGDFGNFEPMTSGAALADTTTLATTTFQGTTTTVSTATVSTKCQVGVNAACCSSDDCSVERYGIGARCTSGQCIKAAWACGGAGNDCRPYSNYYGTEWYCGSTEGYQTGMDNSGFNGCYPCFKAAYCPSGAKCQEHLCGGGATTTGLFTTTFQGTTTVTTATVSTKCQVGVNAACCSSDDCSVERYGIGARCTSGQCIKAAWACGGAGNDCRPYSNYYGTEWYCGSTEGYRTGMDNSGFHGCYPCFKAEYCPSGAKCQEHLCGGGTTSAFLTTTTAPATTTMTTRSPDWICVDDAQCVSEYGMFQGMTLHCFPDLADSGAALEPLKHGCYQCRTDEHCQAVDPSARCSGFWCDIR